MELTKNDLIGLIQYVSGEFKEDLIDVTEQDAESILNEYLKAINYTRSCEFLKASFKKGDVVLIDGWQERIVVQEFENGCVELESKNGCTLIGKGRLTLAPKSL